MSLQKIIGSIGHEAVKAGIDLLNNRDDELNARDEIQDAEIRELRARIEALEGKQTTPKRRRR